MAELMTVSGSEVARLKASVQTDPYDVDLRRVYADALEEAGNTKAAAYHRRIVGVLEDPLNADLRVRVSEALKKANGSLRARKVAGRDVEDLVAKVASGAGYDYVDGGGVANSYGYRAFTALVLVVLRDDGKVCVDGGQAEARRGGGTPANVWKELVQWRDGKALDERVRKWAASR